MITALLWLVLLSGPAPRVEVIDLERRVALRISGEGLESLAVSRSGDALRISLSGVAGLDVVAQPRPPILELGSGRDQAGATVSIQLEPDTPHEVRRTEGELLVVLGEEPAAIPAPSSADLFEQMARLWPARQTETDAASPEAVASETTEDRTLHWRLGPFVARPRLAVFLGLQGSALTDSPEIAQERYIVVQPGLAFGSELLDGRLRLEYLPTFRGFQNYKNAGTVSHLWTGGLSLQPASTIDLSVNGRYLRGSLEAQEVDPGQEYFFGFRPFRETHLDATLRLDRGGMGDLDLLVGGSRTDLEPGSGFFDNDQLYARARLSRELGASRRLGVYYGRSWVPDTPERVIARSTTDDAGVDLESEVLPLTTLSLKLGYAWRDHPLAIGNSSRFQGYTATGEIRKEFSRGANLTLTGSRGTTLSNYEQNAYYLVERLGFNLALPLPIEFQGALSGALQFNRYPLPAEALSGDPRLDKLRGFAVGLSHTVTRYGFIRIDYQFQRRISNLPEFTNRTGGFVLGFGLRRELAVGGR